MVKFNIRNFLNKLIWDDRLSPDDFVIVYLSRGAPGDREEVVCSLITKVHRNGFEYKTPGLRTKYIPFHRVLVIKNRRTGEVVFTSPRYNVRLG